MHSWVANNIYPYKLATLNADIGLCPIADNMFNSNKSAIKWMEYSVMGLATIASDLAPYNKVIQNGKDGLLVNEHSWFDAMERLIKDTELRKTLAKNAYDKVESI